MLFGMILWTLAATSGEPGSAERNMAPANNPGTWATNDDYPVAAMREEREGTTGFRLTVGVDGLPTGCEIISPSGHGDLDATTCDLLMRRARFTPGRDAAGQASGGTYSNRIRWQIPRDGDAVETAGFALDAAQESWPRAAIPDDAFARIDPAAHYPAAALEAREEGLVAMELAIDATGRVTACKVNESSQSAALDDAACALMRSQGKFQPALDSDGKATKSVLAANFRWTLPDEIGADGERIRTAPVAPFPMSEPGSAKMTMIVGVDGRITDCRFTNTNGFGAAPNGFTPCDMFGTQMRYTPFTDAAGKPVAKRVTLRTDLTIDDAESPEN